MIRPSIAYIELLCKKSIAIVVYFRMLFEWRSLVHVMLSILILVNLLFQRKLGFSLNIAGPDDTCVACEMRIVVNKI
jgi:hypothetical protein